MKYPWRELFDVIRSSRTSSEGWPRLLDLCRKHAPDPLWDQLGNIRPDDDVAAALLWLQHQFVNSKVQPPRGIYLGLDTLNQKHDPVKLAKHGLRVEQTAPAKNVEIAISAVADPEKLSDEWAYAREGNWYGKDHLIASLVPMKDLYEETGVSSFADHVLFLGYSGLILAEALERATLSLPFLAIWGFHDGDLFYLCRRTGPTFERLAKS